MMATTRHTRKRITWKTNTTETWNTWFSKYQTQTRTQYITQTPMNGLILWKNARKWGLNSLI